MRIHTPIPSFRHPPSRFSPQTGCFTLTPVTIAQQSTRQQPSQPRLAKTESGHFIFGGSASQPDRSSTQHSPSRITASGLSPSTQLKRGPNGKLVPFALFRVGSVGLRQHVSRRLESGSSAAPQANRQPRVSHRRRTFLAIGKGVCSQSCRRSTCSGHHSCARAV